MPEFSAQYFIVDILLLHGICCEINWRRTNVSGIQLIVYGIGNPQHLDLANLKTMASYPYQVNLRTVDRFQDLEQHEESFRELICNS